MYTRYFLFLSMRFGGYGRYIQGKEKARRYASWHLRVWHISEMTKRCCSSSCGLHASLGSTHAHALIEETVPGSRGIILLCINGILAFD